MPPKEKPTVYHDVFKKILSFNAWCWSVVIDIEKASCVRKHNQTQGFRVSKTVENVRVRKAHAYEKHIRPSLTFTWPFGTRSSDSCVGCGQCLQGSEERGGPGPPYAVPKIRYKEFWKQDGIHRKLSRRGIRFLAAFQMQMHVLISDVCFSTGFLYFQ